MNFSGVVEGNVGSAQFQIVPCSSLYFFSRSIGPFNVVGANYRVLICCTCHFQSASLFFFYFGILCLQTSSVSNFRLIQGGKVVIYLGSLVQLCCGEGGTLQTNITGLCGECSQCLGHTGFAPAHGVCVFLVYTAQAPGCSAGELSKVGPGLCALPRSKPLRFRFSGTPQRHRLSWACIFVPVFCALPRSEQLR